MKNRLLEKYMDITNKTELSERDIISVKNQVFQKNGTGREWANLISDNMQNKSYYISIKQTVKGYDWLNDNTYKKNLKLRKNPKIKLEKHRRILKKFSCFKFIGFKNISKNCCKYMVPIYRVYDDNLNYFDYHVNIDLSIEVINESINFKFRIV